MALPAHQNPLRTFKSGLGLRAPHLKFFAEKIPGKIDFFEIHPENYIRRGGFNFRLFEKIAAQKKIFAHGLTLGFGNPKKPEKKYLRELKKFLREYNIPLYSDHLCISAGQNFFYHDLLPMPFSPKTAQHAAEQIKYIRDILNTEIAVENVSTYARYNWGLLKNTVFRDCSKMVRCEAEKKFNEGTYREVRNRIKFFGQRSRWPFS